MRNITFLLLIVIMVISCQSKHTEFTKENINENFASCCKFSVDTWNSSYTKTIVEIPIELKEKFTEKAIDDFQRKLYSQARDEKRQQEKYGYSWQCVKSESFGDNKYFVQIEITNVTSLPFDEITILINDLHKYRLTSYTHIRKNTFGKLQCEIPYSLYKDIKKNGGHASIEEIKYCFYPIELE